jgi:predicted RNA-binding protein with TRAM domain
MTKAKENKAEQVVVVEVTNTEVKLGRPVNESSRRQQILKLREAKKQNGEFKLGRPVKEGSARQLRLQELANKAANGELKRGRPVKEGSARQLRLQELESKKLSGIEIKRGRPKMDKVEESK